MKNFIKDYLFRYIKEAFIPFMLLILPVIIGGILIVVTTMLWASTGLYGFSFFWMILSLVLVVSFLIWYYEQKSREKESRERSNGKKGYY